MLPLLILFWPYLFNIDRQTKISNRNSFDDENIDISHYLQKWTLNVSASATKSFQKQNIVILISFHLISTNLDYCDLRRFYLHKRLLLYAHNWIKINYLFNITILEYSSDIIQNVLRPKTDVLKVWIYITIRISIIIITLKIVFEYFIHVILCIYLETKTYFHFTSFI